MRNKYYRLFTEEEIPHQPTRAATNCYNAILYLCNRDMENKCRENFTELFEHCPRQIKSQFKHKEKIN